MRILLPFLLISLCLIGCQSSENVTPETITGSWVEASARRDTLYFNVDQTGTHSPNYLLVQRGKAPNPDGYLIPKLGSGIYQFSIQNNRIYVHSLLSSSSTGAEYAITFNDGQIQVENFFELAPKQSATATRTLVRLR